MSTRKRKANTPRKLTAGEIEERDWDLRSAEASNFHVGAAAERHDVDESLSHQAERTANRRGETDADDGLP